MGNRRIVTSLAVAAAVLILSNQTAEAGEVWCALDPILQFADGSQVQWVSQFDSAHLHTLTGPVAFGYEVPSNVGPIIVSFPTSPAPETVSITYTGNPWDGKGGVPVRVTVTVAAKATFKTVTSVRGNVVKSVDLKGWSNSPDRANAKVDPTQWYPLLGADAMASSVLVSETTTVRSR